MIAPAIRALLLTWSSVTTLVGQRVYTKVLPQNATLPAIRVQRIDDTRGTHLRGADRLQVSRVQVDSVALVGAEADAIDRAVDGDGATSGLLMYRGTIAGVRIRVIRPAGVRERFDAEELKQFMVQRDYFVHWTLA